MKSEIRRDNFNSKDRDGIYYDLKANKCKLGDIGSGNHFLDALESYDDDYIFFSIHTGLRNESKIVDLLIDKLSDFDLVLGEVC